MTILRANDDVSRVMQSYEKLVLGSVKDASKKDENKNNGDVKENGVTGTTYYQLHITRQMKSITNFFFNYYLHILYVYLISHHFQL